MVRAALRRSVDVLEKAGFAYQFFKTPRKFSPRLDYYRIMLMTLRD
jgi:hypothetical protein